MAVKKTGKIKILEPELAEGTSEEPQETNGSLPPPPPPPPMEETDLDDLEITDSTLQKDLFAPSETHPEILKEDIPILAEPETNRNLPVPQGPISSYLAEINKIPLLSPAEEKRLALLFRDTGDMDAAHKLVVSNLRFVVKVAYEYSAYGLKMSDLIQEGNIGLMMAVKKFDPNKGYRLISYAVWWIRAMIQGYILRSWSLVKIGTTQAQRKLFYKLSQTKRALSQFLTGEKSESGATTTERVAHQLDVREKDVREMEARMSGRDASLNQPLSDDNATTGLDMLESPENQEEAFEREERQKYIAHEIQNALKDLNEKERFIVEKRLMADEPMTLQEIGDHYKISRERARQLEERAKLKLRNLIQASNKTKEFF